MSSGKLLKDFSWIRKPDDEDEDVDRDPNHAKSVLRRYRTSETPEGESSESSTQTITTTRVSSVQALTKRFSTSQEALSSSTLPTKTSYTRSTYSTVDSDSPGSTKTTTVTKDGTTETITTTTQSVRSPVLKTPTKTETFTERVKSSSSKSPLYSTYSPTKTTKTVTSPKYAEDKLYDTLIPAAIKNDDYSPTDSKTTVTSTEIVTVKSSGSSNAEDKLYDTLIPMGIKNDTTDNTSTVSSTETVTIKSSIDGDGYKTTTTTRTSSQADDDPFDTLKFRSSTSDVSSPIRSSITKREVITVESSRDNDSPTVTSPSSIRTTSYSSYKDDVPSSRTTSYSISSRPSDDYSYSYTRPDSSYEYSSISSPTVYSSSSTSYRSSSRSDDDPSYSKSSIKSVYTTPERTVLEKDLCTYCHKPFTGDAKMVLDDMKINCHATCFKCDVCNNSLGNLKAGDSMWIYKRMVHCENCFGDVRDKWRR